MLSVSEYISLSNDLEMNQKCLFSELKTSLNDPGGRVQKNQFKNGFLTAPGKVVFNKASNEDHL